MESKGSTFMKNGSLFSTYIEKKETPVNQISPVQRSEKALNRLERYECCLMYFQNGEGFRHGKEVAELIMDKEIVIDMKDNQYPSIYLDGEFVASIAPKDWICTRPEKKYDIADYKNQLFRINEIKKVSPTGKTIEVIMSIV